MLDPVWSQDQELPATCDATYSACTSKIYRSQVTPSDDPHFVPRSTSHDRKCSSNSHVPAYCTYNITSCHRRHQVLCRFLICKFLHGASLFGHGPGHVLMYILAGLLLRPRACFGHVLVAIDDIRFFVHPCYVKFRMAHLCSATGLVMF